MMLEKAKFTADEVAYYLTKHLITGGKQFRTAGPAAMKGWLQEELRTESAETGENTELDPFKKDRILSEVFALVRERQDLIRQIVADSSSVSDEDQAISQDEVLAALDLIDTMEEVHLPGLTRRMDVNRSFQASMEGARKELARASDRVAEVLAEPGAARAYREEMKGRIGLIRLARNVDSLYGLVEKCELAIMQLVARRNSEDLPLTTTDLNTLKKYETVIDKARSKIEGLIAREDVFYETKRRGLLEYRRQLMAGGFVETATVKNKIMRVMSHLQAGIPVFLRGHLGVGKTELALHVCRHYLGVEPEFISGSEEATKYDIYGRTQIGVTSEAERMAEWRRRIDQYRRTNPELTERELKEVERRYYETIVVKGQTSSFFQEGPLVRAIRAGKPLIIDEMDGIPHSIIMRMNHVLTRRPGDKGRVQESGDEEITVQKGFCVIATGNVKSARYKREDLDAAFLSRWWSEDIRYPPRNETYEILTAALIDRRGDLQVKTPGDLDDLKRLTEVAGEIQQIFMGEHLDYLGEGADAARGLPAGLKKSVLSLRHLWNIVRPWKAHHFSKPLEHYILEEFIKPSVAEDQVYLVQLFCRFRFFKEWTVDRFEIPGLTEAKLLAFQGRMVVPG